MNALISDGDAVVVAGLIGLVGTIITVVGVQLKVHKDNRKDHAETATKVDMLIGNVKDVDTKVDNLAHSLDMHLGWHSGQIGEGVDDGAA